MANTRHTSSWSSARMLTQNEPVASIWGQLPEDFPGQKPTNGGSSEIEKNEPTAMPTGPSAESPVTTVTPVGKWPSTWRNRACSSGSIVDSLTGPSLIAVVVIIAGLTDDGEN